MYAITYKNAYLHTDGRFYIAFISTRGCFPKIYKSKWAAEKRAQKERVCRGINGIFVEEI